MNDILKKSQVWLPYTQMQNHIPQLEIKGAKGSKIFLKNGEVLIDGIASWWSAAHGYNHPHIIKNIIKQAKILPHIMIAGFAADETYRLAERICKFSNMDYVFFSDSGSVAVEVAMKIAWQYFINLQKDEKAKFISFKNSYHGDTTGAMSLADLNSSMHKKFAKKLLKNFNVDLPQNKNDLDKFEDFVKKNRNILAAIFIEPMAMCAGGMRFYEAFILREIYNIAKKNNILFIADECAVGFYRLGKKFACDFADIKPDILILSKALSGGAVGLGATLTTEEIFEKFLSNSNETALMHGPTFMGNPLACSAGNASLDLFEKENYEKKTIERESFLKKELEICRNFKNVKDVRVLGNIAVVETNFDFEKIKTIRKSFVENGIFIRPFSGLIYLMPALNISKNELKKITDTIIKILQNYE
jgi:adenosylmethionine-8-amino-7-oxononanoate aminotransferase